MRYRIAGLFCAAVAAVGLALPARAADTPIVVGFDPNFPPYQYLSDGEAVGAHIDLLNRISEMAGLQIDYRPLESGYVCRGALQNGEIDVVLGSVYGDNAQPRLFSESQPISQSQLCMFAPRGYTQLIQSGAPLMAAYQAGTVTPAFLSAFRSIRCMALSNQMEVVDSVMTGRADVMIGVKSSIEYQLRARQSNESFSIANNYMLPIEFCMLVRSEDQRLLRALNSALYELRISGEYESIMNSWVADENQRWHEILSRILRAAALIGTMGLCVVLFNVRINMLLKRQVAEKTGELAQKNRELEEQIEQTRKSNELQRYIIHSSPNAIVVFDTDRRVTLFNENARILFNAPWLEVGCLITDIPMVVRLIGDRLDQLDVPSLPSQLWEESLETEEGMRVTYRVGLYQLYSTQPSGNRVVRGASLSVRDITRERQMRERENEREKNLALNRLIAGIAHEIRNPLTAIKAYTMMLPQKMGNPEFQAQMVRYVPMEVDRVNTLITNLIDYAKPRTAFREEMLIDETAESCIILISPLLRGKEIELKTDLAPGLRIFCDRSQFKQVLINLFFNAIEATEEKQRQYGVPDEPSPLFLRCWEEGETCRLSLEDRGIGMTPDELSHATEAFFTTKERGSGLGLAISRQYVIDNGGEMEILSEKGEFTKITLTFERDVR